MSADDRILRLQRERERHTRDVEIQKKKIREAAIKNLADIGSKFAGKTSTIEEQFKTQTIGLKTREEFQKTREELEKEEKLAKLRALRDAKKKRKQRSKEKKALTNKLSFVGDDEEADDDMPVLKKSKKKAGDDEADDEEKDLLTKKKLKASSLKNPHVDTSFLPDADREAQENMLRQQLADEWEEEQSKIKEEFIDVTYSYWDGTGHRANTRVKKGESIEKFLAKVQRARPELRAVTVENLIYVKEDVIIPHHYTFYDLIVTKARGKSGPLFHFDVHDDVRLLNDVRVEKDESHAGKVCERRWYESNKHIWPASRWETYDPKKQPAMTTYSYGVSERG